MEFQLPQRCMRLDAFEIVLTFFFENNVVGLLEVAVPSCGMPISSIGLCDGIRTRNVMTVRDDQDYCSHFDVAYK
eukprot:scaffold453612_cov17-Prasinocladus_malaysianus.AAC.1